MEMIVAIIALVISGIGLVWNMSRDKKEDNSEIDERLKDIEKEIPLLTSRVNRLEADQSEMKQTLKKLEGSLHETDKKIERMLGILETIDKQKNKRHMPLILSILKLIHHINNSIWCLTIPLGIFCLSYSFLIIFRLNSF